MKNNENPLDVFRAEWRHYGANLAGGLSPELTFVDDRREQRRYYLHAAILALLLAALVDACSPASGTAAVRNSHNMTRTQAISETTKLMVTGEKA